MSGFGYYSTPAMVIGGTAVVGFTVQAVTSRRTPSGLRAARTLRWVGVSCVLLVGSMVVGGLPAVRVLKDLGEAPGNNSWWVAAMCLGVLAGALVVPCLFRAWACARQGHQVGRTIHPAIAWLVTSAFLLSVATYCWCQPLVVSFLPEISGAGGE